MTEWITGVLLLGTTILFASVTIGAPRETDDVTAFAVDELARYLDLSAGKRVCELAGPEEGQLRVGLAADLGEGADPETFVLDSTADGILLTGASPRATLYAVYAFLEQVVGCRWYYPGEDIVPHLGADGLTEKLNEFSATRRRHVEAPDFPVRMRRFLVYDLGQTGTPLAQRAMEEMLLEIDWMAKNRMNIFQFALDHNWDCYTHWDDVRAACRQMRKRGIVPGMGGHNMHMFMRATDFEEHPDWMPFYDGKRQPRGQFCTSNEQAVRHYIDGLSEFLEENPQVEYLAPWPNDMGGWCQCDLCQSVPMPDRYMELGKTIYRELGRRHPNVRVTHFAYGSHMQPPETERPLPGMTLTLCTWGRDLSVPFDSEGTGRHFRDTFRAWKRIADQAGVPLILHAKYARHLYLGQHAMPLPTLSRDLKWFKQQGLGGFELPMAYMGRRTKGLNLYVLARLMWRADQSVDELLGDYFATEYGPLNETMRLVYEGVEHVSDDYRYSGANNAKVGTEVKPGMQVSAPLRDYASRQLRGIGHALGRISSTARLKEALEGQPGEGQAILRRIGMVCRSLEYLQTQWRGLQAVARAGQLLSRAQMAHTQDAYTSRLDEAQAAIGQAVVHDKRRRQMAADVSALPLLWDVTAAGPSGGFDGRSLSAWQELIAAKRQFDITTAPKRVWQIGSFDGAGDELGDEPDQRDVMLKMPAVVTYRVPEDWPDRQQWPDLPRSHWPRALDHGARIELVFDASPGRYRLVVGQLATWETETVPVLLDAQRVGCYETTVKQATVHNVEFAIGTEGEHTLTLGEFEQGGGYCLDAIRLEKLP